MAFSDADWVGDPDTQRSVTSTCIFFGSNLLSWTAKKQPMVSHSSAESEYRALASTIADKHWFCYLLRELGVTLSAPPLLLYDNVSALSLAHNPVFHARSRHIEIDFHFMRELIKEPAEDAPPPKPVEVPKREYEMKETPLTTEQIRDSASKLGIETQGRSDEEIRSEMMERIYASPVKEDGK